MSRVGEKIKEARLKAGMTQKALGKKLGVAEKFINEVEIGRKIVQESFIEKAAKILNVSVWAGLFATLGSARSIWLVAENKQKYTLVYTSVGCIVNVILNCILIPKQGAFGAAIATLMAQLIANVFALMPFRETRESSIMILKSIFINKTCIDFARYIEEKVKRKGEKI